MDNSSAISVLGVGQIAINVYDLPRAVQFYRDVLGMTFLFDAPKMAFLDCGGIRLMLAIAEKPEFNHPASIIYYRVVNTRQSHQQLVSQGVEFLAPPQLTAQLPAYDLWMAFLRDPEGNPVALMSEEPRG